MIVIATATVMDGLVVRWYQNERAAEYGNEAMSVSRKGVRINCYLHEIPVNVRATAVWAHEQLAAAKLYEEVRALATHRHKHMMGHEIEPLPKAGA